MLRATVGRRAPRGSPWGCRGRTRATGEEKDDPGDDEAVRVLGGVHGYAPNPCLLLVPATRNGSSTRRGGCIQTHDQGLRKPARNLRESVGGHGGTGEDLGVESGGGGGTW